jgi:hypothetical protein
MTRLLRASYVHFPSLEPRTRTVLKKGEQVVHPSAIYRSTLALVEHIELIFSHSLNGLDLKPQGKE